jgi:hypothetical protein
MKTSLMILREIKDPYMTKCNLKLDFQLKQKFHFLHLDDNHQNVEHNTKLATSES